MSTKRIFTSIDLSDEAKAQIKSVHNKRIYPIKWMDVKNLHITLNFLGELTESKVVEVEQIMENVALGHAKFDLRLSKFLSKRHMLWLLVESSQSLRDLKRDLSEKFKEKRIGKRERRSYSPHIMIAQTKNEQRKMKHKPENFGPIELEVTSVNLYESKLTPGSATHTLIKKFPLE